MHYSSELLDSRASVSPVAGTAVICHHSWFCLTSLDVPMIPSLGRQTGCYNAFSSDSTASMSCSPVKSIGFKTVLIVKIKATSNSLLHLFGPISSNHAACVPISCFKSQSFSFESWRFGVLANFTMLKLSLMSKQLLVWISGWVTSVRA